MFTSENKTNSIRNALFDAAVQLSVPTVISTASAATKMRAFSTTDDIDRNCRSRSPTVKSRYSLTSNLIHSPRRVDPMKPKVLRDVATQSSPMPSANDQNQERPNQLNFFLDNNNNPTETSPSISDTSKDYLSVPRHGSYSGSPSTSPTRNGKSLKNTLLGIWQGLNNDEMRSTASSPIDPKFFEDRVRLVQYLI